MAASEMYKKGGLLLSENTLILFDRMTDDEGFKFLKLICSYHRNGTLPPSDTERIVSVSFDVFKADYDASQKKYREKVVRMLKNRGKQEIGETSQEIGETSQEIGETSQETCETSQETCETSQEIETNTIHDNTSHNNTSYKESKPKKDVSLSLSPDYVNFKKWLKNSCPHLHNMCIPTEAQYFELLNEAGSSKEKLKEKLMAMENNKDVPKKQRSIYLTCLAWLRKK